MRSDVALYIVAGLFFVLALISVVIFEGTTTILFLASTVVLGILSIGLGQYQKLKMKNSTQKKKTTPPPVTSNTVELTIQPALPQEEGEALTEQASAYVESSFDETMQKTIEDIEST